MVGEYFHGLVNDGSEDLFTADESSLQFEAGTFIQQTPYGVVASTAGVPANPLASLTTGGLGSSMLPILLIGGGVVLSFMAKK